MGIGRLADRSDFVRAGRQSLRCTGMRPSRVAAGDGCRLRCDAERTRAGGVIDRECRWSCTCYGTGKTQVSVPALHATFCWRNSGSLMFSSLRKPHISSPNDGNPRDAHGRRHNLILAAKRALEPVQQAYTEVGQKRFVHSHCGNVRDVSFQGLDSQEDSLPATLRS